MNQQNADTGYETLTNPGLIENSLRHLTFEMDRERPSYFRVARESHLVLYRSMVEALKGTANLAISYPARTSQKGPHRYKMASDPWKEIRPEEVRACSRAWRFSDPVEIPPPDKEHAAPSQEEGQSRLNLISFYPALAMIQAECFMCRLMCGKPVTVTNEQMATLEWLHEEIRNEFEHFMPKFYLAKVDSLVQASVVCLTLSGQLLFHSGNVFLRDSSKDLRGLIETEIGRAMGKLKAFATPAESPDDPY